MTAFRLLALDIDGTLLASDKTIRPRTRDAVRRARESGVRVVLVTGRRYPAARHVAQALGDGIPLVLHNGALIVEDGVVVRCAPLPRAAARAAILAGRAAGADPVVHCGHAGEGRLLIEAWPARHRFLASYLEKSGPDVERADDLERRLVEDPLQVMFGGSIADMDALLPRLRDALGDAARIERTVYPQNDAGLLDVLHPGVGKADALARLCARWGIAASETLAIGDNWNDQEMLTTAGLGFVMGNADPELLRLGLPALPTNDEDGVAVAIESHLLA